MGANEGEDPLETISGRTPREHWWTMTIHYQAYRDDGTAFRATSAYNVLASSVGEAYAKAEADLGDGYKLGAIIPGKHAMAPL